MENSWPLVKLSDCATFQEGYVNPSQKKEEYFGDEVKWLRATDLNNGSVFETSRRLSQIGFESAGKSALLFEPETLAISKSGTIGRVGILKDYMCGNRAVINIKVDPTVADNKFVFYVLRHYRPTLELLAIGSVQPNLYTSALGSLEFNKPDLVTQKSISKIISSLDDKIELNHLMNQTLEQMAQALFKSWFVDFDPVIDNALAAGTDVSDFPEALQHRVELRKQAQQLADYKALPDDICSLFPSEFEQTEQGWIPKSWAVNSIHNMVDTISKTFKIKEVDEVIFLNTGDIENGKLLHSNYSKTNGLPGQAKKSIAKGDILYSEIRPKNKRFAFVNIDTSDYVVSTKLMVLRAKGDIDPLLPYFILTQEKTIQNLQHVAEHRSGTFPQITYKELADVKAVLPNDNKLVDYFVNNYLKPFYDKQFSSIAQNEQLEKLRDTLLPKLISGEISIKTD